jgi:hypothetical protein
MPSSRARPAPTRLRVGDLVEVRSPEEIRDTLDADGALESLPFMPEMLRYCGRRFRVAKVAHKLCDTVEDGAGFRRMDNAVHLRDVRCDGAGHGGCQAACLMYWKTAWLKPVPPTEADPPGGDVRAEVPTGMATLLARAARGMPAADGAETYRCQSTALPQAAPRPLPVRNPGQYLLDVRSGNVSVAWAVRAFAVAVYNRVQDLSRDRLPPWLRFRGGLRWGLPRGRVATRTTPSVRTDLRPGERVRIRSRQEIEQTLNADLRNRGLGFDAEMARFCGRTATVARRVEKIIDERTGRMRHMRNPCVVLEGIVCEGAYSVNCPRAIPAYWREAWLERIGQATDVPG